MPSLHSVVIDGIKQGFVANDVTANVSRMFKVSPEQATMVLSNPNFTVKRGITHEVAQSYLAALDKVGVQARLVSYETQAVRTAEIPHIEPLPAEPVPKKESKPLAKGLICDRCGAAIHYAPGKQTLECPYCKSSFGMPNQAHDEATTEASGVEYIVPMAINTENARGAMLHFMATKGNYTPDDIFDHAEMTDVEQYYAPIYNYSGQFEANWTASFGFDHTEHYTEYVRKYDHDSKSYHQEPETRKKTVTDWQTHSGIEVGTFSFDS